MNFYYALEAVYSFEDRNIWPNFQNAIKGSIAAIYCDSAKPVQWTFMGSMIPVLSNTLIFAVSMVDKGLYICQGKHASGKTFYAKSFLNVTGSYVLFSAHCFNIIDFYYLVLLGMLCCC